MTDTSHRRAALRTAGPDRQRRGPLRARVALIAVTVPALSVIGPYGVASADSGATNRTVYTQSNAVTGNEVLALQEVDGQLQRVASYVTGGAGTGSGLGSQGSVVAAGAFLYAVDAGSNQLSVFRIGDHGALHRTAVVPTGGIQPLSVTVHRDLVYVVNAGDGTVTGFRRHDDGQLSPLGVTQPLTGAGAAEIAFDRTGSRLIVTEKGSNTIDVLPVTDGLAGVAVSSASTGQTPFGFAIDQRNHVIVSNAAGGASGASTLTSYRLTGATSVTPISAVVPDTQSAACWVLVSGDGRFAFTTNTGSGTISSYQLGPDGSLDLLQPIAASTGAGPIDMARRGRVLFTLNSGSHTVTTNVIGGHGQLANGASAAVPDGVVGLAVAGGDRED